MNWAKSDLMVMEYLNGFDVNYIEDVMLSHGTQDNTYIITLNYQMKMYSF